VALILGGEEAAKQSIQVKSLRNDAQQLNCNWSELSGTLAGLLGL
jgi:histidyl-tRNA synthetase